MDRDINEDVGSIISFTRAKRAGSHVLISMEAGSGRGKTLSALLLGRGLVGPEGRLGMVDTETGRGQIYAEAIPGGYEYGELTAPYSPERYIASLKAAEAAGLGCLIIDSGSHEWEGIGGVGEIADANKLKGLAKWASPKARHKKFVQTLLQTRMHIIVCLRSKERLLQTGGEIVSQGWWPVQEKSFGFEMTVRLAFPEGGKPGVPELAKCPEDLLGAFPSGSQISVETGARIAEWVRGGVAIDSEFHDLKREAEEAAEGGSAVLATHWKRLTPAQRKKIERIGPNLRSIADTADREAEEQQTDETGGVPSFANNL